VGDSGWIVPKGTVHRLCRVLYVQVDANDRDNRRLPANQPGVYLIRHQGGKGVGE
jgi:hypothetical protein